jgi:hypothetical protein
MCNSISLGVVQWHFLMRARSVNQMLFEGGTIGMHSHKPDRNSLKKRNLNHSAVPSEYRRTLDHSGHMLQKLSHERHIISRR